jgi:hypothetical protein
MNQAMANHQRLLELYLSGAPGPHVDPISHGLSLTGDWELASNFARLAVRNGFFVLDIAVVGWYGHSPYLRWTAFAAWDSAPSLWQRLDAAARALEDERFFRRCYWCGSRNNEGHMSGISLEETEVIVPVCQSCATHFFGVVY